MAPKIHELLAIEPDAKNEANTRIEGVSRKFAKHANFDETLKTYSPLNEADMDLPDEEFKPMATTVADELEYLHPFVIRMLDIIAQKEASNAEAKADLIVEKADGTELVIAEQVQVSTLVQLENLWKSSLEPLYRGIPVADVLRRWTPHPNRDNVIVTDTKRTQRTRDEKKVIVLYEATEKHPAQTQLIQEKHVVGHFTMEACSGAMTDAQKKKIVGNVQRLIAGIKKARSRANLSPVKVVYLGEKMIHFVMTGE